jgi:hypothetical protein
MKLRLRNSSSGQDGYWLLLALVKGVLKAVMHRFAVRIDPLSGNMSGECSGAVVEFGRNVLGLQGAHSTG